MIIGIGIDAVAIDRFNTWHTYPQEKLLRIFSEQEISYCLNNKQKSAERFAARFAAREAFFKALGQKKDWHSVWVEKETSGKPTLHTTLLSGGTMMLEAKLSLSHEKDYAIAFVVLSYKGGEYDADIS